MERMEAPDMPLGLMMSLAEDLEAMQTFSNLSPSQQAQIVHYIQDCTTGDDAKRRIETVVGKLHNHSAVF